MQIHNITRKTKNKSKRSVGRGGKRGKTAGRGTKGQKARAGRKIRPEIRDMIKRLPKMRGRGKNIFTSIQIKPTAVSLESIEKHFAAGETVSPETLATKGVISRKARIVAVKILSDGAITKKVTISGCKISAPAREKIEKAGGTIQ
jgi:large subunit ribosomal protein L15